MLSLCKQKNIFMIHSMNKRRTIRKYSDKAETFSRLLKISVSEAVITYWYFLILPSLQWAWVHHCSRVNFLDSPGKRGSPDKTLCHEELIQLSGCAEEPGNMPTTHTHTHTHTHTPTHTSVSLLSQHVSSYTYHLFHM